MWVIICGYGPENADRSVGVVDEGNAYHQEMQPAARGNSRLRELFG